MNLLLSFLLLPIFWCHIQEIAKSKVIKVFLQYFMGRTVVLCSKQEMWMSKKWTCVV